MNELVLRNEMLWGREAQERLAQAHVILFGLGGVGSYTAECLARSGIGQLTIVDNDVVSPSNRNRQLEALGSTVGPGSGTSTPPCGSIPSAPPMTPPAGSASSRRAAITTTSPTPSTWSPASWTWRTPPGGWASPSS